MPNERFPPAANLLRQEGFVDLLLLYVWERVAMQKVLCMPS